AYGLTADAEIWPVAWAGVAALIFRAFLMVDLENTRAACLVGRFTLLEGTQYALSVFFGVVFIWWLGLRSAAPLWGVALANLLMVVAGIRFMMKRAGRFAPRKETLSAMARYGVPLSLTMALELVIAVSDRFFIGWFMDESAVGVYAVGYALADRPLGILFTWVGMAVMPLAFAAMEREGPEAASDVIRGTAESLILIALPAAVGLAVVAKPLVAVLAGEAFRETAAQLIPWIALSGLMHGVMVHFAAMPFALVKRNGLVFWTTAAAAVLNVVLNVVLIPRYGLMGAVAATVASYILGAGLCVGIGARLIPLTIPWGSLFKGIAASACMAAGVIMADLPASALGLGAGIGLGMVIFAVCAYALNLSNGRDKVHSALSRLRA
ncbi:MAG: polysaccharide biosynthesis protein, partial [Magnetococcales bacterium]|nr:polysaccharide biosynthesis protein [Magnetococcales bacterium]